MVLDDLASRYHVDPKRVFVLGHSNGGFMAHRLACDLASRVAAIVSMAGATYAEPNHCHPSEPVSILQLHGDLDAVILFGGGPLFGGTYPSASQTAATWASLNGCTGARANAGTADLVVDLLGAETRIERYAGCPARGAVELWTMVGAPHVPALRSEAPGLLWDFLSAHAKP